MTDIAEGKMQKVFMIHNFKTLKVGKTGLATHDSQVIGSWHLPHFFIFAPHFSTFTINKLQSSHLKIAHFTPFKNAFNYKNIAYKSIKPETCFGKL